MDDLIVAAHDGHSTVVERLLASGADVNQANESGETPLYWAARHGYLTVVERLLASGADVNQADKGGRTPLYCAAYNGHSTVVERLVEYQFKSEQWIRDVAMFKTLSEVFQRHVCTLARCWSAKSDDSGNLFYTMPLEMFHSLLMSIWEEDRLLTVFK